MDQVTPSSFGQKSGPGPLTRNKNFKNAPNSGGVLTALHLVQAHEHFANTLQLLAKDVEKISRCFG